VNIPAASGRDRSYRPDIDGIRAIAVLSVVFYHAGVPRMTGGFTGVDIFFVISGYLIGGHIFTAAWAGNFSFLGFYQRRAKRILPAFYGMLVFAVLAAMFLMSPQEAKSFAITAVAATLSASNFAFWYHTNYFDTFTNQFPLLNTWSLGVEEQFYAVIPLLIVLLVRIRRSLLLPAILTVCTLSFLLAWYELGIYPNNVFYLLPERAWELGAGVAWAVIELRRKRLTLPAPLTHLLSLTGLALIAAPIFLLTSKSPFPGPAALPSVLGTVLLIAVPASFFNQKLLSLPPVVFIGRISYSLYLWHWPILAYLHLASGDKLSPLVACIAVIASFAAAVASYYVIEQPFRRSTMPPGPLLIRYAVVSLLALVVCSAIWLTGGVSRRFPALAQIDHDSQLLKSDACLSTNGKLRLSTPCYNAADARPLIAIWGDSHAAALAPGLRPIANAAGYGFAQLTHGWCAPLAGAADYLPEHRQVASQCMQFNRQALAFLTGNPNVRIVILTACWSDSFKQQKVDRWLVTDRGNDQKIPSLDEASLIFRQSLQTSIQALLAAGKKVIVLQDVPKFESIPLTTIRTARIPARHTLATWMGNPDTNDAGTAAANLSPDIAIADTQLKLVVSEFGSVPLIDLTSQFCHSGNQCVYRIGDRILYLDSEHLTPFGADYALRNFHLPNALGVQQPASAQQPAQ
jgi:peptidoglycan/LPS O-acetylase OafA/YrhL